MYPVSHRNPLRRLEVWPKQFNVVTISTRGRYTPFPALRTDFSGCPKWWWSWAPPEPIKLELLVFLKPLLLYILLWRIIIMKIWIVPRNTAKWSCWLVIPSYILRHYIVGTSMHSSNTWTAQATDTQTVPIVVMQSSVGRHISWAVG